MASRGASVAFNYLRAHESARKTEQDILDLVVDCLRQQAPLNDPKAIDKLFSAIDKRFGKLDILVNNAAFGVMRPATTLKLKHWAWTLETNTRAPWLCAIAASKLMRQGGKIINITSPGSTRVLKNYSAVGVSKAALEALTRYLAIELAHLNIGVNAVSAGYVLTNALNAFPNEQEAFKRANTPTPAGRIVEPEDVAGVVAFLCEDRAEMIRGQVLLVDGGRTIVQE